MKLTFLGTGTSTGVPQLRCDCPVCMSNDPCDSRMRCSAIVEPEGRNLLIDCGPDFRQQMVRFHRHDDIDALIITHQHYDHVGGIDDLRPYCKGKDAFPIYCQSAVGEDLRHRMPYCFETHPYPGVPKLDIHTIEPLRPFKACGMELLPLPVNHYKLDILGFRIGPLAYITDAKTVPQITIASIRGVDTLVINALRIEKHMSHMSLDESLEIIDMVRPHRAYLTHMSHDIGLHADLMARLPQNVFAAYDGLTISI